MNRITCVLDALLTVHYYNFYDAIYRNEQSINWINYPHLFTDFYNYYNKDETRSRIQWEDH